MKFLMQTTDYPGSKPKVFDEHTAPKWLCEGGLAESTMDNRWFWNDYVLTLKIGQSVDTDFQTITRLE
jgi:hypothetical protein